METIFENPLLGEAKSGDDLQTNGWLARVTAVLLTLDDWLYALISGLVFHVNCAYVQPVESASTIGLPSRRSIVPCFDGQLCLF